MKTIEQQLSEINDRIGNLGLDKLQEICFEEQTGEFYFIPIVLVAGVKDGHPPQLIASTCMFGRNQPSDGIARLLRVTAQHLLGEKPEDNSHSQLTVGKKNS